jgi:hypothetical protein
MQDRTWQVEQGIPGRGKILSEMEVQNNRFVWTLPENNMRDYASIFIQLWEQKNPLKAFLRFESQEWQVSRLLRCDNNTFHGRNDNSEAGEKLFSPQFINELRDYSEGNNLRFSSIFYFLSEIHKTFIRGIHMYIHSATQSSFICTCYRKHIKKWS